MSVILVGTDFSSHSGRALAKAAELAQRSEERVHLLHVVEPVDEPDSEDRETQEFYDELTQRAAAKFQEQESKLPEGVELSHSVEIGPRVDTIMRVAQEMDASVVVLGSQPLGEGNPSRLGVSHRIALTSSRPVLLVP